MQNKRWWLLSVSLLLLTACGQRGPLYMPEQPPQAPDAPQTQPEQEVK